VDGDRRALDAGLLAFLLVEDLGRESMALGPAQVHPEQHLGPVGGLGPAGAGADHQEGVAIVVLAPEEQRGPLAPEVGLQGRGVPVELGFEVRVGAFGEQVDRGLEVVGSGPELAPQGGLFT
jgi:hypothetical protein